VAQPNLLLNQCSSVRTTERCSSFSLGEPRHSTGSSCVRPRREAVMDPLSSPFHAHTLVVPALAEEAAAMQAAGGGQGEEEVDVFSAAAASAAAAAAASSPPAWSRSAADVAEALLLAYAGGDAVGDVISSRSPSPSLAPFGTAESASDQRAAAWLQRCDDDDDEEDDDESSNDEQREEDDDGFASPMLRMQQQRVSDAAGEQAALEWPPGFWQREDQPRDFGPSRGGAVSALGASSQGLVSLGGHDGASSGSSEDDSSEHNRSASDSDDSSSLSRRRQGGRNKASAAFAIIAAQQSVAQAQAEAWRRMCAAPAVVAAAPSQTTLGRQRLSPLGARASDDRACRRTHPQLPPRLLRRLSCLPHPIPQPCLLPSPSARPSPAPPGSQWLPWPSMC